MFEQRMHGTTHRSWMCMPHEELTSSMPGTFKDVGRGRKSHSSSKKSWQHRMGFHRCWPHPLFSPSFLLTLPDFHLPPDVISLPSHLTPPNGTTALRERCGPLSALCTTLALRVARPIPSLFWKSVHANEMRQGGKARKRQSRQGGQGRQGKTSHLRDLVQSRHWPLLPPLRRRCSRPPRSAEFVKASKTFARTRQRDNARHKASTIHNTYAPGDSDAAMQPCRNAATEDRRHTSTSCTGSSSVSSSCSWPLSIGGSGGDGVLPEAS